MRQGLDFILFRSGQFNSNEMAVLAYINTFSEYCAPRAIADIGRAIHKSDRTVRYVINRLVEKGILIKRYRCFKRVWLQIVDLTKQKSLHGFGMIKSVLDKALKSKDKDSDRQPTAELDRQPTAEPIKNKTEKNKTSSEINENELLRANFRSFLLRSRNI